MTHLQQYQEAFTNFIRDPKGQPRPRGSSVRGMRVYVEIVFNNMEGSLSACFPVCKKILGVRAWKNLVRVFLSQHRCTTPLFRQIPEEFLQWLETAQLSGDHLPPFLFSLAHYEWMELAISVNDVAEQSVDAEGDLLEGRPVLAGSFALLEYPYQVHRISPRFRPTQPDEEPTCLLMFRDLRDEVHFVVLNQVSARLLHLLKSGHMTGRQALEQVAVELRHPDPQVLVGFGAALLERFRQQGAVIGLMAEDV